MNFHKNLHRFQDNMFNIITYIIWILYIIIALGLSARAPEYLIILQTFTKIYISLFLMYRFNPFRRVKFTDFDAKIAFSAGVFLIATTAIDELLKGYLTKIYSAL